MNQELTIFVVVGPGCYGSSKKSVAGAVTSALKHAPRDYRGPHRRPMPYNAYKATADWSVDGHGRIEAAKLQKLKEHRP